MSEIETLFPEMRGRVDPDHREAFDELLGLGASPSSAAATIRYVTTTETQAEAAAEFDVSAMTIRNWQEEAAARVDIAAYQMHDRKGGNHDE
jgi:hypothetical protein